ncbi:putative glycosyltransferase EpsD [compost metagenome]
MAKASVFVLPSYYREGLPRSTQEAMSLGKPIITTDWVGCRETVLDGVNGFLVPVKDPERLAAAMLKFIESPSLIDPMGEESRRLAEQRYDVSVINNTVLSAL